LRPPGLIFFQKMSKINTFFSNFSRAIMCYLVNKYSGDDPEKQKLYPTDPEQRAIVDRSLFFDIGSLYKSIVDYFVSNLYLSFSFSFFLCLCLSVFVFLSFSLFAFRTFYISCFLQSSTRVSSLISDPSTKASLTIS
jgi:hypothetical protein